MMPAPNVQTSAEANGNSSASLGPASSYIMDTLLACNSSSISERQSLLLTYTHVVHGCAIALFQCYTKYILPKRC